MNGSYAVNNNDDEEEQGGRSNILTVAQ